MSHEYATWDAAYLLGGLAPDERREYQRHLAGCPECRRAVRALSAAPDPLAPLAPEHRTPLPALVRRVRRTRRRRWALTGTAVAVALGCLLVLGLVVIRPAGPNPARPPVAMTRVGTDPLWATVHLLDEPWGTRIDLACGYRGTAGSDWYTLVVTDRAGTSRRIAGWGTEARHPVNLTMDTSLHRDRINTLEVRAANNHPVLRLALH